jgi:hypothetical protein
LIAMDAAFTLTGYTASDVDGTAQAAAPRGIAFGIL